MRIISGPSPFFLGQSGIGQNFGQIAPQIKFFDVYYDMPIIVGLQIIGEI
jgi:hypothetical protein